MSEMHALLALLLRVIGFFVAMGLLILVAGIVFSLLFDRDD